MFLLFLYGICSGCLAVSFRGCNSQNSLSKTDYFLQGNVALPRGLPTPENSQHKNVLFQRSQANFPCFVCTSLARIKPISGLSKNAWTASSNTTSSTTPSAAWRDVVFLSGKYEFPAPKSTWKDVRKLTRAKFCWGFLGDHHNSDFLPLVTGNLCGS